MPIDYTEPDDGLLLTDEDESDWDAPRPRMSGLSPETADAIRAEMARRTAAGLSPVPDEMDWED